MSNPFFRESRLNLDYSEEEDDSYSSNDESPTFFAPILKKRPSSTNPANVVANFMRTFGSDSDDALFIRSTTRKNANKHLDSSKTKDVSQKTKSKKMPQSVIHQPKLFQGEDDFNDLDLEADSESYSKSYSDSESESANEYLLDKLLNDISRLQQIHQPPKLYQNSTSEEEDNEPKQVNISLEKPFLSSVTSQKAKVNIIKMKMIPTKQIKTKKNKRYI